MPWIGQAIGVGASLLMGGGGSSTGGSATPYIPSNVAGADTGWQQAFTNEQNVANQVGQQAQPYYLQSLQAQEGINYAPYQAAANQAGQQYGNLATLAGNQANIYGGAAETAGNQQNALYGAANQVLQTSMDPQSALFQQTQQQLTDQVNAGQAARGLGNSPVGGQEYNQAMSNFDINWQNQQLARQAQGITAASQGSQAGMQQGQLQGADLAAQLSAQGQVPTYTQQSGQVPIAAQQYVAGQPAAGASAYQTEMGQLANLYGGVQNQAIPYMNAGIGAQQTQQQFNAQQQAGLASGLTNMFSAGGSNSLGSQIGSGVSNWFSGAGASTPNFSYANTFGAAGSGDVLAGTNYSFG